MKLEIISRKAIKPSSPTPQHLQTFKLSLWDQRVGPIYGATIFFYHKDDDDDDDETISMFFQRSHSLQKSLSNTLNYYYPLAGRLTDDTTTIDCDDQGAYFVEARLDCNLSTFLSQPEVELLNLLNPTVDRTNLPSGCMLAIQITLFNCGGIAISTNMSHKIADASSMTTFVMSWTSMAREEGSKVIDPIPIFSESSFSPSKELFNTPRASRLPPGEFVTKRFVFPTSKIAHLKENIKSADASGQQQHLSTVDVVLALILKSAVSASRSIFKSSGPCSVLQIVDMRNLLRPPLPKTTMGNIFWDVVIEFQENQVTSLNELAGTIRKTLLQFYNVGVNYSVNENGERPTKDTGDTTYCCTSLCKLPLYEVDFGWGKPSWVCTPMFNLRNLFMLLKARDGGGIEAWISLDKEEMAEFEVDHEIVAFTSKNAGVLLNSCCK